MTAGTLPPQATEHEVKAHVQMQLSVGNVQALAASLDGAVHHLQAAGLDDYERRAARVVEHLRLLRAQIEALAKRVAGGEP